MTSVKKGDRISEYILEEPLGQGGFGQVWRARHHMWSDRQVAVKIPTSPEAVRELANEGTLQAALHHPGIARTLGMDPSASPPYFITEFVPGKNLRTILEERGPMHPRVVLQTLDAILEILEYAHSQGVVHQDIKPENVMRTPEGEIKLTDFGLGQNVNGESLLLSASLRSEGAQVAGTLPYIAPEIRDGHGRPDGRSDLYSLGIVFFELLTGKRPAGGEVPSDLNPALPHYTDEIFRGLYTRRENRFPDVAAVRRKVAKALKSARNDPRAAPLESRQGRPRATPLEPPASRMTMPEACRVLGLSDRELRHWIQRGKLGTTIVHGKTFLNAAAVYAFQKEYPRLVPQRDTDRADPGRRDHLQRVRGAPGTGVPVESDALRPAGFMIRGLAMAIDLLVLVLLIAVVPALWMFPASMGGLLIPLVYFSVMHGVFGRTLGKTLLGLKVVRLDGSELSFLDGIVRTINYALSAIPFGLGFFVTVFSRRRLAFHDLVCGTRVIHVSGAAHGPHQTRHRVEFSGQQQDNSSREPSRG